MAVLPETVLLHAAWPIDCRSMRKMAADEEPDNIRKNAGLAITRQVKVHRAVKIGAYAANIWLFEP